MNEKTQSRIVKSVDAVTTVIVLALCAAMLAFAVNFRANASETVPVTTTETVVTVEEPVTATLDLSGAIEDDKRGINIEGTIID